MAKDPFKKWSRLASAILVPLILSGVAVALAGRSNQTGGTFIVQPGGQAVLSGAIPDTLRVGQTTVTSFYLTNGVGSPITAHLELILSRDGIQPTDMTVTLAGNSPVIISCDVLNCTYVGTSWTIPVAKTGMYDIGITPAVQGNFAWSVIAIWSTT